MRYWSKEDLTTASARLVSWCVTIAGSVLVVVGVLHNWMGLASLQRAIARGEVSSRIADPQLINWAFSGGAIVVLGLVCLLHVGDLGRGSGVAWRVNLLIGSFFVMAGVGGYLRSGRAPILLFAAVGGLIVVPLLVRAREFRRRANPGTLVRTAVLLFTSVAGVACEYESAGVAAGLTAESLSQLRRGMTRDDVLRVLGPPLSERTGSSGMLIYARSRTLSMGNYWMTQPERECVVLLENDFVSEAYLSDSTAGVRCSCRRDACAEGWASKCLGSWR